MATTKTAPEESKLEKQEVTLVENTDRSQEKTETESLKAAVTREKLSKNEAPKAEKEEDKKEEAKKVETEAVKKTVLGRSFAPKTGIGIASSRNSATANNGSVQAKRFGRGGMTTEAKVGPVRGILEIMKDAHGVLRVNYAEGENDIYIGMQHIRRLKLRPGDIVEGTARELKEGERYRGLVGITKVNGYSLEEYSKKERVKFYNLTAVYPDEQVKLELGAEPLSLRIIDLLAPIGKGQRSLIVSPPKAGKTTLIKEIATGAAKNHPEIHLMAVLVGERPEEITDIGRHIAKITDGKGETAASGFDEPADQQCAVAELALERAKRMVEEGKDVLILLDSITRLARAYNLSIPTSGRTLSGGFDPAALQPPKRFFGAARNFERPGSLTIVGTALVETGSRMDDLVYEEFKGTGNQEVHLDRRMAERRIYPGIEAQRSGTRRDDLMIDPVTYQSIMTLNQMLDMLDKEERTETLLEQLKKTKSNKDFLASLRSGF